jgi:hypothetical protein
VRASGPGSSATPSISRRRGRRGQRGEVAHQPLGRRDLERLAHQQLARLRPVEHLDEQVAHLQHGAEAFEHGGEALVLTPRRLEVDDVVVEEVFLRARRDGEQLGPRRVDDDGLEPADLGRDVDGHARKVNARWPRPAPGPEPARPWKPHARGGSL